MMITLPQCGLCAAIEEGSMAVWQYDRAVESMFANVCE